MKRFGRLKASIASSASDFLIPIATKTVSLQKEVEVRNKVNEAGNTLLFALRRLLGLFRDKPVVVGGKLSNEFNEAYQRVVEQLNLGCNVTLQIHPESLDVELVSTYCDCDDQRDVSLWFPLCRLYWNGNFAHMAHSGDPFKTDYDAETMERSMCDFVRARRTVKQLNRDVWQFKDYISDRFGF